MKHTSFVILSAALAWTLPLLAADDIHTRWMNLCHVAGSHQLNVSTTDGKTVTGFCSSTDAQDLFLISGQSIVKIERSTLTGIQMPEPGYFHHLSALGGRIKHGLQFGAYFLGLPYTLFGAAIIPATLVWGAVSAPFCLLGDIGDNGPITRDVKLID